MIKIAPSILAADFTRLGADIDSVRTADQLHFDVMDGCFVPNISFGFPVLASVRNYTDAVLNTHLMITEPLRYVERFCAAGADIVTVHAEADSEDRILDAIRAIHDCGKKAGISLKPGTPVSLLMPFFGEVDEVLVMTVEPGFGGQKFREDVLPKIETVRKLINRSARDVDLSVDGGINQRTAVLACRAGANLFVNGTGVFSSENRASYIERLRARLISVSERTDAQEDEAYTPAEAAPSDAADC